MSAERLPKHIAIIMDGNGRWAKKRYLPRIAGHKVGVDVVRNVVKWCAERQIEVLTVFAFSSENWKRPPEEVTYLMRLFRVALQREVTKLHKKNVRLSIMGDRTSFDDPFRQQIKAAETLTRENTGLHLVVAFNYGGRWDISQAVVRLLEDFPVGQLLHRGVDDIFSLIQQRFDLAELSEPDLLIRTGGEKRVSNFFLWQLAYTEFYFTDVFWPEFNIEEFNRALAFYSSRERRFGGAES